MDSRLNDKLLNAISTVALALTLFLMTNLWSRVDTLELQMRTQDKELAEIMLRIESRMTRVETRLDAQDE
jgi:hypothetical protein